MTGLILTHASQLVSRLLDTVWKFFIEISDNEQQFSSRCMTHTARPICVFIGCCIMLSHIPAFSAACNTREAQYKDGFFRMYAVQFNTEDFMVKTYIKMHIGIVVCLGFEKYEPLNCIKY